ncbi:TonB-dependent receptor [Parvularcula maris]|uniref:TonB-dependent receptor n=1 Tax=Parvularcula maris TaxID=2965077 RepID=A0A9X2L890_9PROT|nr:TonB-dependent receptor [Parvularcula maris]MCQ8184896.1 TonB-dependent receptor [Parvularcula maris]
MYSNTRPATRLLTGLSLLALAAPAAALAQEDEPRPRGAVADLTDVITVTATKSADPEDVQDVPVAVTAFNDRTLDALNVRALDDLSFSMPNVSLDDIGTARGQANFSIRGLGVNSSIGSIDPAVGVFVDGVYLGINSGVVFDIFDLESVEVLRGPQGILFGRNTTGGAVLINTGNPTDEFRAKASYIAEIPGGDDRGGLNQYFMGTVSGPIVEGRLNGKFSAYYNDDNGYFENQFDGGNVGAARTEIIRGALEWMATDNLTFLGKAENFSTRSDGPVTQNRGVFERDTFDVSFDEVGFVDIDARTFSLRTDWELNFGTITNITGYRSFDQRTLGDIDGLPVFIFHSPTQTEQEQISNELRYAGTFGSLDVKAGFFYFHQDIAVNEDRFLPGVTPITFTGGGSQDQDVYGVFTQLDYALTDKLTLTGGLRFSYEEKDVGIAYVIPRVPGCDILDGTCPTNDILSTGFEDDDAWQNLSPKVGFQFTPRDDAQVYGHWTRAFRSGGYNFRITDIPNFLDLVIEQGEIATDEEQVDSFELGAKVQTPDGRGQLNGALFYTSIQDLQREVNLSDPGAGVSQLIANTADANIFGVELEARYALTETFLVLGNLGYINADYEDVRFDISSDGVLDGEDENLAIPRVPELTYGASVIWDLPLGDRGSLTSRVAFQHRDRFAFTDNNFGFIQEADMLEVNLTWQTPVEGLSLSFFGENLLDEVQAGGDTQIPFGGVPGVNGTPDTDNLGNGGVAGPNSNLFNDPFDNQPAFGTLSPLQRGRVFGFQATIEF